MKKLTFIFILTTLLILSIAQVGFAQIKGTPDKNSATIKGTPDKNSATIKGTPNQNTEVKSIDTPEKLEDPLGDNITIEGLLLKLFEIIIYVGVPIVAMFLIWSGFMFVSAQGNPEKIETAKRRLLYTIIGAILLLGAWTISQAIKGTVEDIKRGGTALYNKTNNLS